MRLISQDRERMQPNEAQSLTCKPHCQETEAACLNNPPPTPNPYTHTGALKAAKTNGVTALSLCFVWNATDAVWSRGGILR